MASFTFGPGHPFPVGTTVSAYEDKGQKAEGQPMGPAAVATGLVSGTGALTIAGLSEAKRYWAVAQVSGVWKWVQMSVPHDPDLPGDGELVRGEDLAPFDTRLDSVESGHAALVLANAVNVLDYGADRTGATSSVAAFAAAVAACIPATDPVTTTRQATRALYVPGGTYAGATALLSLVSVQGFRLITDGPQATIFKATANMTSIVDLNGVGRSHFDGFTVQSDSTVTVQQAVRLYWDGATANRSTLENRFDYIEVSNCWCVTGVQIGRDGDSNQVDSTSIGHISMTGGWTPKAVTGVAATDLFTSAAHGFVADMPVVFSDKTAGAGVTVGTTYFVIASGLTANDFKVSATLGGASIDLTSDMTAGHLGRADLWQAGLKVGTGTTGNNFIHTVELLAVTQFRRNLYMARSSLHVGLAQLQSAEHDIYLDGPSNWGLVIESGRSESSVRFIGGAASGTSVSTLHVKDYKWNPSANTAIDREIITYHFPGTVIFDDFLVTPAPPTSTCWANFSPTRPQALFINGWSNEGVEASSFVFSSSVDANVEGFTRLSSGAVQADPLVPVVASVAAVALPWSCDVISISGTADITSITATGHAGRRKTLVFSGTAATNGIVDGSNLKLAGNLAYTPDDSITLVCDGTNWFETGRSVN